MRTLTKDVEYSRGGVSPVAQVDVMGDDKWKIHHGDCIEHMATLPDAAFDLSIFSPPFPSLYAYTGENSDIGNSEDFKGDAKLHLSFFYHQLSRLVKPGRAIVVHCMQIPRLKRSGGTGLYDFRGLNIRLGERAGLVYEYDWGIRKNPQAQAIRTRSRELQFAGLESDRAKQRGALPDYLIKFRAPGENAVAVNQKGQVSRNDWIKWAEWSWGDIRETDTLNVKECRGEDDTKHICPLQLEVYKRVIRLFTDPGEIVFEPFAGMGSGAVTSLQYDRRFYGCELKDEYHADACRRSKQTIEDRETQHELF